MGTAATANGSGSSASEASNNDACVAPKKNIEATSCDIGINTFMSIRIPLDISVERLSTAHTRACSSTAAAIAATTIQQRQLPEIPSDPVRYPIHGGALRMFQKISQDSYPHHIIWLGPIQQGHDQKSLTPIQDIRSENEKKTQDHAILIVDSDDNHTTDKQIKKKDDSTDDDVSVVSWSDSDRGHDSDDQEDKKEEAQPDIPPKMVAVLLNDSFFEDSLGGVSALAPVFKPGDEVEVSKAVMLWEQSKGNKGDIVVSLLGITGKTKVKIIPAPAQQNREIERVKSVVSPVIEKHGDLGPSRKRELRLEDPHEDYRGLKRITRISTPTSLFGSDHDGRVRSTGSPIPFRSPCKMKSPIEEMVNKSSTPLLTSFKHQLDWLRDISPLDLLVRGTANYEQLNRSAVANDLVYLSNLWSATPLTCGDNSQFGSDSTNKVPAIVTRHICWLSRIHRILIRAVCNECSNGYKKLSCDFGCRSHKWRLQIKMDCSVSDGTTEAKLVVQGDQEDVMWTLLGLKQRSCGDAENPYVEGTIDSKDTGVQDDGMLNQPMITPSTSERLHQDTRDKVLKILARRGELSFRTITPMMSIKGKSDKDGNGSNVDPMERKSIIGYVDKIDRHQTHQESTEEKFWLDICTKQTRKRQTFILYATNALATAEAVTQAPAISSPALSSASWGKTGAVTPTPLSKKAQLKTTVVWMNRRTTIQTLVRPPLVLRAVDVEWIQPHTEAKILLDQLRRDPM
ncbi:hypothetical protein EDD11_005320 [Mortierella claussenii]|nr:hypothetical protein EDD11_005320 [Mortierella claussenii]